MNLNTLKSAATKAIAAFAGEFAPATPGDRGYHFSFGDPEPVLSNNIISALGTFLHSNGDYWVPPVDLTGLANLRHVNPYHGPILGFKRNMLAKWFQPSPVLNFTEFRDAALDYAVFDNCYFQKIVNGLGRVVRLKRLPAITMRATKDPAVFAQVTSQYQVFPSGLITFQPDEVIHIKGSDVKQGIYGVPDYLGGIQTALLGENSVLFKRRYFINGAHTGNVFVTQDAGLSEKKQQQLEDAILAGKGIGNFRSIYINVPKSNAREPVKVIPVGQAGTADEFNEVQSIGQEAMLSMHRIPPGLASIIPKNTGGFGDRIKDMQYYHEFEIEPLQQNLLVLNERLGQDAIVFAAPDWGINNKTA